MKIQGSSLILGLSIASTTLAAPMPQWHAPTVNAMVQPDGDDSGPMSSSQSFDPDNSGSWDLNDNSYSSDQMNDGSDDSKPASTDSAPEQHAHSGLGVALGLHLGIGQASRPQERDVREDWSPRARGMPGRWARGFSESHSVWLP